MKLAPIILFVYNRPWHTQQTVEALQRNELAGESKLFIFADGEKSSNDPQVAEVRSYIKTISGFKAITIIERDNNWGLADNIVDGVSTIVNKYGRIIVLEDDIVTSVGFLKYMNDALTAYENEDKVMHVSGYFPNVNKKLPDFFFYNQTSCWGWGTWKNVWKYYNGDTDYLYNKIIKSDRVFNFNIDDSYPFLSHLEANLKGDIKTWAIKWHTSVFLKHGLCLHPAKSYVQNIGFDQTGVHCGKSEKYKTSRLNESIFRQPQKLIENNKARKAVKEFNQNQTKLSDIVFNKLKYCYERIITN